MFSFVKSFISSVLVGIAMAFTEMRTHLLRSSLSILGVMLGVASLVAMLTLIGGIDVFLNEKMGKWIGTVWFSQRDDLPPEEKLSASRSPGLRLSDGTYLVEHSDEVKNAHRTVSRWGKVSCMGQNERASFQGTDQKTFETNLDEIKLLYGRWLTKEDYSDGSRNCIISWQVMEGIMARTPEIPEKSIVGKTLSFNSLRFTVVGVYGPQNPEHNPWHLRRGVFIPLRTMQKYVTGLDPDPGRLQIQVSDPEKVKMQAIKAARVLKTRHRGVEDFEYRTADWVDEVRSMLGNISLLMSIVSAVSLLVGGLSIMNVMLSSISERIKEIGVRKALGAQNRQIFVQFIAETTTLSFSGGMLGIALGLIPLFFKEQIMKFTDGAIQPTILPLHIFYTCCIISAVGILFGLYPALKAAKMNPVDALRFE
ncbi:MAG: ABC transporter permease [Chitinispirillaceae bacterium]